MHEQDKDTKEAQKPDNNGLTVVFPFVQVTPRFIFWFTAIMIILSMAVALNSTVHYFRAGWTLYQAVFNTFRDIGVSIPVVAGIVALALNGRRIWMSIATYIDQQTEKLRQKNEANRRKIQAEARAEGHAEGLAEGHAEGRAWNKRRLQAEARGEPFDEPFPGSDATVE